MKRLRRTAALLLVLAAAAPALTDDRKPDDIGDGFVPLFNGKDLTGWVNVNCAPGTFFVRDGQIITTGKPTGYLRTAKQYENFVAEFDWMHVNKKEVGNSGFFVWADPLPAVGTPYTRGIEVQVLVNLEKEGFYTSQGDLFSIHGATCKPDRPHPQGWARCLPSEKRCKGGGEWNHYKVIGDKGTLKLHVNGKEVSGLSACRPRKGYLALESEGAECHFRNLKVKELPGSDAGPGESGEMALGFVNLYTGLDLSGWEADEAARKHWQVRDYVLHHDDAGEKGEALRTRKAYGDCEFLVDFRFPPKKAAGCTFGLRDGESPVTLTVTPAVTFTVQAPGKRASKDSTDVKPAGQWNRLHVTVQKGAVEVTVNRQFVLMLGRDLPAEGAFSLRPDGDMDFANLFVRGRK